MKDAPLPNQICLKSVDTWDDSIDIVSNFPVSYIFLGNGPPFSRQLSGAPNDDLLLDTFKTLLGYPEYRLEAF